MKHVTKTEHTPEDLAFAFARLEMYRDHLALSEMILTRDTHDDQPVGWEPGNRDFDVALDAWRHIKVLEKKTEYEIYVAKHKLPSKVMQSAKRLGHRLAGSLLMPDCYRATEKTAALEKHLSEFYQAVFGPYATQIQPNTVQ